MPPQVAAAASVVGLVLAPLLQLGASLPVVMAIMTVRGPPGNPTRSFTGDAALAKSQVQTEERLAATLTAVVGKEALMKWLHGRDGNTEGGDGTNAKRQTNGNENEKDE